MTIASAILARVLSLIIMTPIIMMTLIIATILVSIRSSHPILDVPAFC